MEASFQLIYIRPELCRVQCSWSQGYQFYPNSLPLPDKISRQGEPEIKNKNPHLHADTGRYVRGTGIGDQPRPHK
jgi:hypothetical protein